MPETFLILRIIERNAIKMYIGLHVKCPVFLVDFNETLNFLDIFEKHSSIKFHENPSSESRVVHADRRTDMTKLIVFFASKNKVKTCLA